MAETPVNSKVTWGAAGAAGGSVVGAAVADIITSLLQRGAGLMLTEKNLASIEILVVAGLAYGGSFLVGFYKDSGFTAKEQANILKDIKEKDK